MARKNVKVLDVLKNGNYRLNADDLVLYKRGHQDDPDYQIDMESFRMGVATLMEDLMHEAEAYAGYTHTDLKAEADGSLIKDDKGYPIILDESRRKYFAHNKLLK